MTKRIVSGSRNYPNPEFVKQWVDFVALEDTLIVGRSPRGVDRWAEDAARARGMTVIPIPADWEHSHWGKLAGKVRNVEMIVRGEKLTAFWDGWSNGTAHAIAMAAAAGKLGRVVLPDDVNVDEWYERLK